MSRKGLEGPENGLQSVMFHRQLLLTHAPRRLLQLSVARAPGLSAERPRSVVAVAAPPNVHPRPPPCGRDRAGERERGARAPQPGRRQSRQRQAERDERREQRDGEPRGALDRSLDPGRSSLAGAAHRADRRAAIVPAASAGAATAASDTLALPRPSHGSRTALVTKVSGR